MQPAEQKKKRSPWLYVGIGCGTLLLLVFGAVIAGGLFLFKKGQQYQEDLANPVTRTAMVKKTLGAQTLPEGYHAVMSLSVPACAWGSGWHPTQPPALPSSSSI